MSRKSLMLVLLGLVISLGACRGNQEKLAGHLQTARLYYKHKKFADSLHQFYLATDTDDDCYEAWLGYANASRELGSKRYIEAHYMKGSAKGGSGAAYASMISEAGRDHMNAGTAFNRANEIDPDRLDHWYGMGLLHYQRLANPVVFPDPIPSSLSPKEAAKLLASRNDEMDRAIDAFVKVAEKDESFQVRRYLGILLMRRGMLGLEAIQGTESLEVLEPVIQDVTRAREYLMVFHESTGQLVLRERMFRPVSEQDRQERDALFSELQDQLDEMTGFFRDYLLLLLRRIDEGGLSPAWKKWMRAEQEATRRHLDEMLLRLKRLRGEEPFPAIPREATPEEGAN